MLPLKETVCRTLFLPGTAFYNQQLLCLFNCYITYNDITFQLIAHYIPCHAFRLGFSPDLKHKPVCDPISHPPRELEAKIILVFSKGSSPLRIRF